MFSTSRITAITSSASASVSASGCFSCTSVLRAGIFGGAAQSPKAPPRWLKKQASQIPQKIAISFGSAKKPIAFLPRQPCEDDPTIFSTSSSSCSSSTLNHQFSDFEVDQLEEGEKQQGGEDSNNNNHQKGKQVPIASLESSRLGLPPILLQRLRREHKLSHLTPVQAKMLQRAFLLHDVAVSSETGSGKTLGLCIALVAKLLRSGPMRQHSSLFLVPSDALADQVAKWIISLWPHEADKKPRRNYYSCFKEESKREQIPLLHVCHSTDTPQQLQRALFAKDKSLRPLIIISVPSSFWNFYDFNRRRKETLQEREEEEKKAWIEDVLSGGGKNVHANYRLGYMKRTHVRYDLKPLLPWLDNLVVDEADEVLPFQDEAAPGNLLVADLTNPVRFKSPLQLILNSATLSPATVSHIRRYLRKNVFAAATTRIFDGDYNCENNSRTIGSSSSSSSSSSNSYQNKRQGGQEQETENGEGAGEEEEFVRQQKSMVRISDRIFHQFFPADNEKELGNVLLRIFQEFHQQLEQKQNQQQDSEEKDEKLEKNSNLLVKSKKKKSDYQTLKKKLREQQKQQKPEAERQQQVEKSEMKVVLDKDGYETFAPLSSSSSSSSSPSTSSVSVTKSLEEKKVIEEKDQSNLDQENTQHQLSTTTTTTTTTTSNPKILLVYPDSLLLSHSDEMNQNEEQEQEQNRNPMQCAGNLKSLLQLESLVSDILSQTSFSSNFDVSLRSVASIRGLDDKNVSRVVILAKPENVKDFVHWSGRVGRLGRITARKTRHQEQDENETAIYVLSRSWVRVFSDICERLNLKFRLT